jgi:hypothetical protein
MAEIDVRGDECMCVCLHNMIIENKLDDLELESEEPYLRQGPLAEPDHQVPTSWDAFLTMR